MSIEMEHNFCGDEYGDTSYIPTLVDSSIPAVLAYRGVPARRIMQLIADLDSPCPMAAVELDALLPGVGRHGMRHYEHTFDIVLEKDIAWTGRKLTLRRSLPDTVIAMLPGRTLHDVIDHPALPDRRILSVETKGGDIVIHVEADPQPVLALSGASDAMLAGSPTRNRQRRAWIDEHSGAMGCESEWNGWIDFKQMEAVNRIRAGESVEHGDRCWGDVAPTVAPVVNLARNRMKDTVHAVMRMAGLNVGAAA